MLRVVFTVCGIAHLWFGRRALARTRSWIELLYAACILSVGALGLLWPAENSVLFDQLTHVIGLSLLLKYVGLTLGLVCGFASLSALIEGWSRWHRVALVVYAALVLALCAVWSAARGVAASNVPHLLYRGYYGRPLPLLVWNALVGLTIVYSCALLILEMARAPQAAQDREARVAIWVVSSVLFVFGGDGGLMIAGQALASRLGFGATGVVPILNVTTATAVTAVPILNTWSFYVLPLWRILALRRDIRTLRGTRQDLVRLLMLLGDRLVHLIDHADPTIVRAVAVRAHRQRLRPDHLSVVLGAARWIVFSRAVIGRRPWSSLDAKTREMIGEMIVKDAARRSRSTPHLYADVYLVVILALGEQYVPDWLQLGRDPQEWHHALAALIVDGVEGHNGADGEGLYARHAAERQHTPAWSTVARSRLHWGSMATTWRSTRRWFSLSAAQQERTRILDDLVALQGLCDDLLIYLRDQTAPDAIRAVVELCCERHVSSDQDRVAREAARWIGFFLPGVARGPWEETIAVMGRDMDAVSDSGQQGVRRMYLLADVSKVVLLVLRPEQIPMGIRPARERAWWHRRSAELIRTALTVEAPTVNGRLLGRQCRSSAPSVPSKQQH